MSNFRVEIETTQYVEVEAADEDEAAEEAAAVASRGVQLAGVPHVHAVTNLDECPECGRTFSQHTRRELRACSQAAQL